MANDRFDLFEMQDIAIFLEGIYRVIEHYNKELDTDKMDKFFSKDDRKLMDKLATMFRRLNQKYSDQLQEYDDRLEDDGEEDA